MLKNISCFVHQSNKQLLALYGHSHENKRLFIPWDKYFIGRGKAYTEKKFAWILGY